MENRNNPLEDKLDKIMVFLEVIETKLNKKITTTNFQGKKNSHLHILIETFLLHWLKEEAKKEGVSLAELCRRKLRN
jgi:hypothetical protein